mmetsp:Transcript_34953/g.62831  ORF Transcript_34953/g.62831 Transcript_34953/m.62831 type:complete len:341 (-) Transcript_34953:179-1201(-)|eukprot:CAMPEP_0175076578 /NCGR_PEP_ID=MMETSP0052_2-20121109/22816_1 /TAXON_ID=51329 ORGANISM="Polytomella parva, Strain SAG 63-3" /NCGR_SAMPLE_ID=MMETSP0052_2 /ASSEMBLY_ACC=CAM_ASM_000194 /LENGTH=340 /DNA_ID=CAMNT_0016345755 /DNA_START=18 /DNA_END=1040 /DNA_ORIENTATION=+
MTSSNFTSGLIETTPSRNSCLLSLHVEFGHLSKKPLRKQQQQLANLQAHLEERTRIFQIVNTENQRLTQRLRILESILPYREQTLTLLYKKLEKKLEYGSVPIPIIRDRAVSLWLDLVRQCSLHVLSYDAHPSNKFHLDHARSIISKFYQDIAELVVDCPQLWLDLLQSNLETGQSEEVPEEHWNAVTGSVSFSEDQVRDFRAAFSIFKEKMSSIFEERRTILLHLHERISIPSFTSQSQVMRTDVLLHIDVLSLQLRENIYRERSAKAMIAEFLAFSVFTPYQIAKMYSVSYPYIFDSIAVLNSCINRARAADAAAAIAEAAAAAAATIISNDSTDETE